ncbi:ABC transporter substrate-binding protein [Bacillus alveayuensis]|uniref:ABC transporter substrate-binding protein n=1 Tax=Aeribacillus alveayuensis TaxID=279215 RepID=UPI0005CD08BE|nr:ABC transporter substrate-binding protein [Bacillus alveayuensis]
MRKVFLICLVIFLMVVTGCSGKNQKSTVEETSIEPKAGGELVISDATDANTLDPHKATTAASMRYIENMYSTLLRYKSGTYGELEGDLAKEYSISEDGKVYTFKLHEGVKFHNGDPLTSKDVKYSIERIIANEVRAPQFEFVEKIETPDDHTVVITLKQPVAPFLTFLAYPMNAIVNKNVVEQNNGSLDKADAGSGPFQLVEWKKDQHLILEKFPDYFVKGKPYLDKVIWKPIADNTARTTALRNKEIDIMLQVEPQDIKKLENNNGIVVKSVTGTFWEYLGLNTSKGPLANKKVRQAIAWAIDRESLNKLVKFGQAKVLTGGPIPEGHWAHDNSNIYPKRDLEKAKQLMKEAGYEKGFKVTLKVSPKQDQVNAAQIIKQQLKEIGIEVEVLTQEPSIFFDALGKKDFEMTVVGWVGFVDPDEYLYNIFHTGEIWNQQNYSNPKVDELLEKGRVTIDQEERKKIYADAQKLIAEDAPMVFLYVNKQTSAFVDSVKDFDVNPTVTTISLRDTWLDR